MAESVAQHRNADRPDPAYPLTFSVASRLDEVLSAWRLVHDVYVGSGLIRPQSQRIHTAPQAVGAHSAVIVGRAGGAVLSTLTAIGDGAAGLPLDRAYPRELGALRRAGRRLVEIGLFADRRRSLARSAAALYELMRHAYHFGVLGRASDFVIGVHPRHARFYARAFGFFPAGPAKAYLAVNSRPVVLLRGNLKISHEARVRHPVLAYCANHPLPATTFAGRFDFAWHAIARSPLAGMSVRELGMTG